MNTSLGRFAVMLIVLADLLWVCAHLPRNCGAYILPVVVAAGAGGRSLGVIFFPDKVEKRRIR